MVLSRRNLLSFGPSLLAAAHLTNQSARASTQFAVSGSSAGTFEGLVNSSFAVHLPNGERAFLVLTSVEKPNNSPVVDVAGMAVPPPRHRNPVPRTDVFTLNFFTTGATFRQGTYQVEHATLGSFDLFLVPSGNTGYAAPFNRLLGPERRA